jgi:hypothetical protein
LFHSYFPDLGLWIWIRVLRHLYLFFPPHIFKSQCPTKRQINPPQSYYCFILISLTSDSGFGSLCSSAFVFIFYTSYI